MKQRIFAAVLFGVGAALSAIQMRGALPATKIEWLGLAQVFVVATYGKFATSTALLAPNRDTWTPEERAAVNGVAKPVR